MDLSPPTSNATRKAAGGLVLALSGGLAAYYAPSIVADEKARTGVRVAGIAAVAGGLYLLGSALPDAIAEIEAEASGSGGIFGAFGKLLFGQAKPGIVATSPTTNPASSLGKPRNIKGLVGAFTQPLAGESVSRDLFSDSYLVKLSVANMGTERIVSPVRLLLHEEQAIGGSGDQSTDSDPMTFEPSGVQTVVTMRVPVVLGTTVPFEDIDVTARAYVAGYLVAGPITFTRN